MTDETRLDEILRPDYVAEITVRPLAEVRQMKRACDEEEAALSYARRILQGKIDLITAELDARSGEMPTTGAADIADVFARAGNGGFRGRFPRIMTPPETRETRRALKLLADPVLMNLETVENVKLSAACDDLKAAEREISALRAEVHRQIDVVEGEITRRYASGEASVDELLRA